MATAPTPSFRAAVEADLPFLVALRVATMGPSLQQQGLVLSDDEHRQRAGFRLDAAAVIEVAGTPAGMIKVVQDGTTWTIEQFQLLPERQRQGLGTTVLRALIADARASGALLRVSVAKQNPAARLYARLGFRTLDESANSYRMTFIDTMDEG